MFWAEKLGGSLHVNDLRRLSPSDSDLKLETTYFGDAGSANLHSFQHNVNQASTDIQIDNSILENENVDLGTIYFYFNLTIRRSLTFALAGKSDWLYCDNDSCINEETLNFGDLTNPNTTEVTSFRCRWALSGAIKVSIITKIVPKLHRLSDLLSEGNEGTLLGLVAVSLPIHCNGWIRGVLPFWRRKHHTNDLTHLKASIRDTLSSIGMSIPFNENWIILELIEGLSNRPKPRRYILWPANLCFVATPKQVIQALKGHTAQHLAIMDPIARAEAWFHGRHEREHVAKHEQNQNSKMDQHSQFEDALSPINHRSLLQDASTVYPTPPDGANSQNNDTPMKDEDDGLSHHSTADVYGRKTDEYQDMFGDHEMDLTEADFEFFDDPGEADPKPATSATVSATPDDTSSPQNEAPMMDAPSDLENDNQRMETRRDPENTYEAPPSPAILATRNETVATGVPLNHVTQETQQASPAESIATSNVVEDFEDAPVMMSPSMTPDPNIVTTLHHGGTKLDEKYSVHGQFGFSTQSKVGGGSRKDLTQPLKKTIPRIGIAEGSASDSDDESDDQGQSLFSEGPIRLLTTQTGTWERSSRGNSSSDEGLHDGDSTWNERSDQPVNHNPTDSDPIHIHAPPMLWLSTHSQGVSGALQCPHEEAKPQAYSDDPSQFMQMTQLITDHAISQTLVESDEIHEGPLSCIESGPTEPILEWIAANILTILGPDEDPILESLNDVSTDHYESDALYSQKYQLLRLSEPEFCVQRMETKLDMLPAALRLWEDLGLEPRCGGKDVKAIGMPFCRQDHLNEPIAKFVSQMRDTYIACNLGLHDNLGGDSPLEDASFEGDLQAMGTTLSEIAASRSSVVIYVVCYDLSPDTLREVSEGTGQLIQGYKASLPKNESESEIVVQIVPEYLVFNPSYVVTPDFNDLKKLAFEVYDRCAPLEAASQASYRVAPSISLARPIPSQIEFLSTPDAASAKLFHDTRIHLAYAWSVEQGWLTTSWTDNTGDLSWHASYVIGNEEEVWLEFAKAAMELFETTLTMLHPPSRPARVFICRNGTYLKEELEGRLALQSS